MAKEAIKKHSPLPASDPQNHFIRAVRYVSIELFNPLNVEKTKQKAEDLLSQYRRLLRIAGTAYEPKLTTTYKLEMISQTNLITSPLDDYLIRQDEAMRMLIDINEAYNCLLPDERKPIYDKYLRKRKLVDYNIYPRYFWSEAKFYRELKKDLLKFAEAYRHGELLTYQKLDE